MMSDLEADADKGALGMQEVDTSENQELNLTVTESDYIHCFADEFFLFLYFFLMWSF
jgi:hypothetical protein